MATRLIDSALPRTAARLLGGAAATLAAGLLAGCAATAAGPIERTPYTEPLPADEGLASAAAAAGVHPADVWIQPVRDQSTGRGAPVGALRDELYRRLVDRLYTPIALGWGDAQLAEAAADGLRFPTEAIGADAVLEVAVLTWDAGALERAGTVFAEVEVRLIDPRPATPTQLWGRRVARRLALDAARLRQSTVGELEDLAARQLAREVLALLPQRDPVRAAAAGN